MTDSQHQDHKLIILDVVDDSVIADANAEFAVTAAQLQTSRRTWIFCELLDRSLQSCSNLRMKSSKGLRGSPRDDNPVRHFSPGSKPKLFHQIFERNTRLLARFRCRADVSLVLQRLHGTVEELRRHDNSTTTRTAGGDLDRLTLRNGDVVALLATELGKSH